MEILKLVEERILELKTTLKNATSSHVRLDVKDQLRINYKILNSILNHPCPCIKCDHIYTCSKAFLDFHNCEKAIHI